MKIIAVTSESWNRTFVVELTDAELKRLTDVEPEKVHRGAQINIAKGFEHLQSLAWKKGEIEKASSMLRAAASLLDVLPPIFTPAPEPEAPAVPKAE